MRATLALFVTLALAGCEGSPAADAGADGGLDAGALDAGPDRSAACAALGLEARPWEPDGAGDGWDAIAPDFTARTLDGTLTLSERWSGCESFVFVLHTASAYGDGLFDSLLLALFEEGAPRNVHYVFGAWDADEETARARMETLRTAVEELYVFLELPEAERAFWREHVHFVVQPMHAIEGPMAAFLAGPARLTNAFAVTRDQRLDPVGALMDIRGGFVPAAAMARYLPGWYDYLHDLDARLASDGATVVPLFEDRTTTARTLDEAVTLPALDAFDTLEVDVELVCQLDAGGCSEWDRIAHVFVCDDAACGTPRELVRWITPYSRPGRRRWVMDATPLMPLLREGEQTLRVVFGPDWEEPTERTVSVRLRLSDRGATERPIAAELAFEGGAFDATYADAHPPFDFTTPPAATRTELVTIVSGHGQEEVGNCAEWCDHVHTFEVGGARHVIEFPGQAGTAHGCAARTGEGVVPGQWGNWTPLRAGWCPGLPVAAVRHDVTAAVTPGSASTLTYGATFAGATPPGGTIALSTYVVHWAPR